MNAGSINRLVQLVMAGALIGTGTPLVRPLLPQTPLAVPSANADGPAQIVVDARDNLSADELSALNRDYGLDLQYNSIHAQDDKLLIADVATGQATTLLDRLRKDKRVEVAEPLQQFGLPPGEQPFRMDGLSTAL